MESYGRRGWGCLPTLNQKCPKLEVSDAGNCVSLCAFVLCVYAHSAHSLRTFSVDMIHRSTAISAACRGLKLGNRCTNADHDLLHAIQVAVMAQLKRAVCSTSKSR